MTVLLTGATGFIGRHLYQTLIKKGFKVVVLARVISDVSFIDKSNVLLIDQSFEKLSNEFTEHNFDGVIHLASLYINHHDPKDIDNLFQSNILLGTKLLELSKIHNVSWFLNTGSLFQHFNNEIYNPVNLYAATKQAFESVAKYYYETCSLRFATLKFNDTYGPNDTRNKIFNVWMKNANSGEVLPMSSGNQIMDIIFIDDVINGFVTLIDLLKNDNHGKYKGGSFSLISEERMSLKKLAKIFEEVYGKSLNIDWGALSYREREVMRPATLIKPLRKWTQKVYFREGIKKIITYS